MKKIHGTQLQASARSNVNRSFEGTKGKVDGKAEKMNNKKMSKN